MDRLTYRWLLRQASYMESKEARHYLELLDLTADPIQWAHTSHRCIDCGIPTVFGVCTALCRCELCRTFRPFCQHSFFDALLPYTKDLYTGIYTEVATYLGSYLAARCDLERRRAQRLVRADAKRAQLLLAIQEAI